VYASGRWGASYPDNHPSETDAGDVFPGTAGTTILSPWSDSRNPYTIEGSDNHYTLYVPNTQGGTNVGMEVLRENTAGGYFTIRLHSAQQVLPTTISSNLTLNGEYFCTGDVTVNSGVTVTISAGSTIVFQNGTSLYNNGILNVNGTLDQSVTFTSQTGNNQNSLGTVQFNSGSSGSLNYSTIRYANSGIYENGVSVDVSNSAISNCTYGIYLYSSSPTIYCTNIHNNSYAGIYLTSSSPLLYNNYMRNNQYGVYCTTSSNPKFGNGSRQGNDDITGNSYGVFCWNNSAPMLGNSSPVDGGQNNLVNSSWNLYSLFSGVILAANNWWGGIIPNDFKISTTGNVTWSPYRNSPATIDPQPPLSKTNGNSFAAECSNIPFLDKLQKTMELIAGNNLEEARNICLNLVTNYPDYSVSYNALNLLKETYPANEINKMENIYKSLFKTKEKKNLYAMAGLILADIDKKHKLKLIDDVINTYEKKGVVELALFDKFVYYYFENGDKENALAVSRELDKSFPLSQGAVEAHRILGDKEYYSINANPEQPLQKTIEETPTKYALLGNYPNPFNPSTVINYQLKEASLVTLRVYDMLGREVATLVDGMKEPGYYSVTFDGSRFSSGIYLTRMIVQPQEGMPIVQVKKMLLMK
jgi:parallel beta-helix repeat protein